MTFDKLLLDSSPLQGNTRISLAFWQISKVVDWHPFILYSGEGHHEWRVYFLRTKLSDGPWLENRPIDLEYSRQTTKVTISSISVWKAPLNCFMCLGNIGGHVFHSLSSETQYSLLWMAWLDLMWNIRFGNSKSPLADLLNSIIWCQH